MNYDDKIIKCLVTIIFLFQALHMLHYRQQYQGRSP